MTRMALRPSLMQVLLLVLAAVVLTLEVRDGVHPEPVRAHSVALAVPVLAVADPVRVAASDPVDSERQAAHCPYACLRGPAVRPRADHLWVAALLLAGLLLGRALIAPRGARIPPARRRAAVTGTVLLLHLCVCRR